jgi:hypothetical protein
MVLPSTTSLDLEGREELLVHRLVGLYREELQIYRQVLELSRQQGRLIRRAAAMSEIRGVLEQKKRCLDAVGRLEATEKYAKDTWEAGRSRWSAQGRAKMHDILGQVGTVIEQILLCEEDNDRHLIEQASAVS